MKKKELKFYVYILECADGSYYIGFTYDLFTRVKYHYKGEGAAYTRKRLPVELVFFTEFSKQCDALDFEKQIKKWKKSKKKALIEGDLKLLQALSKNKDLKPVYLKKYFSEQGLKNDLESIFT